MLDSQEPALSRRTVPAFAERCRRIATSERFGRVVAIVIVCNAALLGVETSPAITERYGGLLHVLNNVFLLFFIVELAIRITACWPRPQAFFKSGWNVFDFTIVALSLLPFNGEFATVGRLVRLLRIARLLSVSPQLRLLVDTMLRSVASIGHVMLMLGVLVYMYAVVGVSLFRETAPQYFANLGVAHLTLFQLVTLEAWSEMQAAVIGEHPWAWVYFATFIVIAVFLVFNLFIAVVINNLEELKHEEAVAESKEVGGPTVETQLATIRAELDRLEALVSKP